MPASFGRLGKLGKLAQFANGKEFWETSNVIIILVNMMQSDFWIRQKRQVLFSLLYYKFWFKLKTLLPLITLLKRKCKD